MQSTYSRQFSTASAPDITPPTILGNTPTGSNVPVNTQLTVTFSEAMNQASAQSAFSTSSAITGSFSWSGNTMTYTPSSYLAYSTSYTVTIGTGAKDLAGNSLQSTYSRQFSTASALDITPLTIIDNVSVSLHGEKTDVVMGEDILLRLSAVNLITKPKMHVQVIIIPPSGMSVTSSEFSKSGAGQFTANYELEPGDGRNIEVRIKSNQVGDFNAKGRIVYYFGEEKDKAEDQTLNLPIKVRKEIAYTPDSIQNTGTKPAEKSPGFEIILAGVGMILVLSFRRK